MAESKGVNRGALGELIAKCKAEVKDLTERFENERKNRSGDTTVDRCKDAEGVAPLHSIPLLKERKCLRGHFGKIYALHWCRGEGNDEKVVSASQDGKLIVWNALTTYKLKMIPLASARVMTVAYSQSGQYVACGGLDNICSVYRLDAHGIPDEKAVAVPPAYELQHHDGYLSCCRFVSDDTMLTSSGDQTCVLWNINERKATAIFEGHESDVMCLTPGLPNTFVSASCDHTAKVWDTRAKSCVQTHEGHDSDVNSIDLFPDQNAFATGSDDTTMRLFDMRSWGEVNKFWHDHINMAVTSCSFSYSGRLLFGGYDDNRARVWDVIKGELLAPELSSHEKRVSCLGVNRSGSAVCTGSWDDSLKVWA